MLEGYTLNLTPTGYTLDLTPEGYTFDTTPEGYTLQGDWGEEPPAVDVLPTLGRISICIGIGF